MIGVNHRATKNQKDTIKAVSPVRPPLLIPVADSAQHRIQMISRVMHLDLATAASSTSQHLSTFVLETVICRRPCAKETRPFPTQKVLGKCLKLCSLTVRIIGAQGIVLTKLLSTGVLQ